MSIEMVANEMAIFQNHPARSCFALKQCYQTVLASSARKQWFCTQNQICLQSVTILFCNQLFGREFWCPIARSSSCALDRRRHP
jgi:hypothetical protein